MAESSKLPIEYGVPQGSISGPFSSFYIIDLRQQYEDSKVAIYAYDTPRLNAGYDCEHQFYDEIESITNWFRKQLTTSNHKFRSCVGNYRRKNYRKNSL